VFEVRDHVATITLASSGLDRPASEALAAVAATIAESTGDVYAVVIRASGADFCGGWSAAALAEVESPGSTLPSLAVGIEALAAIPQPVVAAIHGRAHSAGLELALACDIRIAAQDASFALPDVALGAVPRGGGTQRLPRAVGRAHALRLALLGEPIDAAEARRIGLVSAVVPLAELEAAAAAQAAVIASRGPLATRLVKEAIHRGMDLSLPQALRYELDLTVIAQTTADRAEGVRAFIERRPPQFRGK